MDKTTIDRYFSNGERELSMEVPWVVDRLTLGLTANTAVYNLPDYLLDIRRVTYQGKKLIPMKESWRKGYFQGVQQWSEPVFYSTDFIGNDKEIRFIPGPAVNVSSGTNPWYSDIRTKLVIEYFRTTDDTHTLPSYLRDNYLGNYCGFQHYKREGHTQNLKASQYYKSRWDECKQMWMKLHNKILLSPRCLTIMGVPSQITMPHQPVLPITQYGYAGSDD